MVQLCTVYGRSSIKVEAHLSVEHSSMVALAWSQGIDENGTEQKVPHVKYIDIIPSARRTTPLVVLSCDPTLVPNKIMGKTWGKE